MLLFEEEMVFVELEDVSLLSFISLTGSVVTDRAWKGVIKTSSTPLCDFATDVVVWLLERIQQ
jgi:hypothetical protein